ncbi:MAG: hypothetical protein R3335_10130 [Anaerolineales bacterium]|nr:hypothetical protein [Anaerolineales bacterium]
MPDRNSREVIPSDGGFFNSLSLHVRLVFRLLADGRVNPLLKLLPVISVVYLFFPDIILGPFDDGAIIVGAFALFIELCPDEIVEEHKAALRKSMSPAAPDEGDSDVIDADYREIE